MFLGQKKKKVCFGTHNFFLIIFFSGKKYNFMHFENHLPFKMQKNFIFSRNLKKILGFTSKFRLGQVTLNTGIFFIWPY